MKEELEMTLKERAEQVRDEIETGANTAERVGGLLVDMCEAHEELKAEAERIASELVALAELQSHDKAELTVLIEEKEESLKADIATLAAKIEEEHDVTDELVKSVRQALLDTIDANKNATDEALDAINTTIGEIQAKLEEHKATLDDHEERLTVVEGSVEAIREDADKAREDADAAQQSAEQANDRLREINTALENLSPDQQAALALSGKVEQNTQKLSELVSKVDEIVLDKEPKDYISLDDSAILVKSNAAINTSKDAISITPSGNGYALIELVGLEESETYILKGKCEASSTASLFLNKFKSESGYYTDSTQISIEDGGFEYTFENTKGRCGIYCTYKYNTGAISLNELALTKQRDEPQKSINPLLLEDVNKDIDELKEKNITTVNSLSFVDELYSAYDTQNCNVQLGKDSLKLTHTPNGGTGYFGIYFVCKKRGKNSIVFNASATGNLWIYAGSASGILLVDNKEISIGENIAEFNTIEQDNQVYYLYIKLNYNVSELKLADIGIKQGDESVVLDSASAPIIKQTSIERKYRSSLHMLYVSDMGGDVDIFPDQFIVTDVNHDDYYLGKSTDDSTFPIQCTKGRLRVAKNAKTARTFVNDKFGRSEVITIPITSTSSVTNPTTKKNIFFMGDSYVANGFLHTAFNQYLQDNGLTNFNMIGRLDWNGLKYEAVGGRAWNDYTQNPSTLPPNHTNPFWNASTNRLDVRNYFNTYCNGEAPDYIICNVGINHLALKSAYPSDMASIEVLAKQFIDAIHTEYPNCKIMLNGCHRGLASDFYYYNGWRTWVTELGELYWKISQEDVYNDFVVYCDIAPYFSAEYGLQIKERAKNMWTEDTEKYFGDKDNYKDYVHPAPLGYKMIAFADFNTFLYVYKYL